MTVETIDGGLKPLSDYKGKPLLIVNTASRCGYTPQLRTLQKLYETYRERGLVVLGFPSNDFGGQEPGSAAEIQQLCSETYNVTFPLHKKVHAKGDEIAPIYKLLTEASPEGVRGEVKWNFTKFLVDGEGRAVQRFEPPVDPLDPRVTAAIEKLLP